MIKLLNLIMEQYDQNDQRTDESVAELHGPVGSPPMQHTHGQNPPTSILMSKKNTRYRVPQYAEGFQGRSRQVFVTMLLKLIMADQAGPR